MARVGDYKIIAGKRYQVFAIANSKVNIERDIRILRKHGFNARIGLDKDYKAGYGMFKKRYLALGRK